MNSEGKVENGPRPHSVKVPRLYKLAAKALQLVEEHVGGLKSVIHSLKHPNVKALTALVSESLRHQPLLEVVLTKSKLQEKEPRLDIYLAKVLITELLWGKKRLGGTSKPVQTIISYQEKFESILLKHSRKNKSKKLIDDLLIPSIVRKPRYVRVNILIRALDEVINWLIDENWKQVAHTNSRDLQNYEFFEDPFVENLLVFCPGTELHGHPLYLDGTFILQDKASCLSALGLKPRRGRAVMDACAAPGMKTSHLAAMMFNEGKIYAVEKDPERFGILVEMMNSVKATCVTPLNADFTDIKPEDYPDVEYILVDPSCSGSGMYNRLHEMEGKADLTEKDRARLANLSHYQSKLLMHAMKFPNVKKIVYSTCSLHSEENEDVIAKSFQQSEQQDEFRIKTVLSNWPGRVQNRNYEWSHCCLKCDFETDQTDGFFVALLEKIKVKSR